jgi:arylsulfatase
MERFGMNWGKYSSANYAQWRKLGGWSISQGQCWAAYSNTPFRKYKKFVHEGGIASPLIAHWPQGIKRPGRILSDPFFHLIDIMPTLCEVAGADYPSQYQGRDITAASGTSMLPYIQGEQGPGQARTLFWQHENHAAVRQGNWKLVTVNDRSEDQWELYNLSQDRSESDNVALQNSKLVQQLRRTWAQWAREVNALPYPETRKQQ